MRICLSNDSNDGSARDAGDCLLNGTELDEGDKTLKARDGDVGAGDVNPGGPSVRREEFNVNCGAEGDCCDLTDAPESDLVGDLDLQSAQVFRCPKRHLALEVLVHTFVGSMPSWVSSIEQYSSKLLRYR